MASPRSRDIIEDLRQDSLARYVLQRVETGPYVCHYHLQTFGHINHQR